MRNNQRVSGKEYALRDDAAFISHTDQQGTITRVNDDFVEISGFAREELIGQPHNIVRHPDMPAELYRDLWQTLKRGLPWEGLIKNRRKNGDHYWVKANVSPVDGGYSSVRIKPAREEIEAAEALYRRLRDNPALRMERGVLIAGGLRGRLQRLSGKLRISHRLWMMVGLSALIFLVAVIIGWQGLRQSRDALQGVYEDRALAIIALSRMRGLIDENFSQGLRGFQHDPQGELISIHDHPLSEHTDAIRQNNAALHRLWEQLQQRETGSDTERALIEDFSRMQQAWEERLAVAVHAMENNNFSAAAVAAYLSAGQEQRAHALSGLGAIEEYQAAHAKAEFEQAEQAFRQARSVYLALLVLGLLGLLWQAATSIGRISRSLREAGETAEAIAAGNLVRPLPRGSDDELGVLLSRIGVMKNALHEMIVLISNNAAMLNTASNELSTAASHSAQITGMQTEAAASMAAAVEELSVSIDQVEGHATDARRVAQDSSSHAVEGGSIIHEAANEMNRIAESVNVSARTIGELSAFSAQIASIVQVIRDIADQTNLLALNAAIEAARAGEQGRGFAVVADEVRKLAERTGTSTQEISAMTLQIQQGMERAVKDMEAGVERVSGGVELARRAGDSVTGIRSSAEQASDSVDDISRALQEQAVATREIAQRVEQIAQGSEENSTAVTQTADAARRLHLLAEELRALTSRFVVA